jgi:penicillin-binding protein 2
MLKGDDRRYRDWKKGGHGLVDLPKAIVESCDVYFYDLARTLGIDKLSEYLGAFGLGAPTGIDLPGELAGILPSRAWKQKTQRLPWFPGETLITGIGQGFTLATPLQLSAITAAMATRGQRLRPEMVFAVEHPVSETVTRTDPEARTPVPIPQSSVWETVTDAMQEVVHGPRGTARSIGVRVPYRIAGKTGTAQVFGIAQDEEYVAEEIDKKLRDHALFIAFAPADDPRIAVAVIVENGGGGGAIAAPIARKVMDAYLLGEPRAAH